MKTHNFEASQFLRIIYKDAKAKKRFAETFKSAGAFVSTLEVVTVAEGLRQCGWQTIDEKDFLTFSHTISKHGLAVLPVRYSRKFQGFAHRFEEPVEGEPRNISIIISKDIESAYAFMEAYKCGDNFSQGRFLGFPECCCRFFERVWKEGFFDPIWQIAENTAGMQKEKNQIQTLFHPFSNPLYRYAGVRFSFHIPCSFRCSESVALTEKTREIAYSLNPSLVEGMIEILSLDSKWSVLHGIAEVESEGFKIVYNSIASKEKYIVYTKKEA